MRHFIGLLALTQVALCAPPAPVPVFGVEKGRTIKEAAELGVEILNTYGEITAAVLDGTGEFIDKVTNNTDEGLVTLRKVSDDTNDVLLQMLDNKIEFILCRIFKVCKNLNTPRNGGRISLQQGNSIEEINSAILDLATDDLVTNERTLFVLNQDYQDYLTKRIESLLCDNGDEVFCSDESTPDDTTDAAPTDEEYPEDIVEEAIDDLEEIIDTPAEARFLFPKHTNSSRPTPTLSLAVHKLFSHLTVKVGFVACKLRVWCPDEYKGFVIETSSTTESVTTTPDLPPTTDAVV